MYTPNIELGTPKNLREAILRELQVGILKDIAGRLEAAVIDRLAQEVGVLMLESNSPEVELAFAKLFQKLRKDMKEEK